MKLFDIVIIGAGPAGGQCARQLTQAGQQVLLVEQHETFYKEDIYYQDNIIAIGDAVSMVNMLGGEGIRHGMQNANIAAGYIQDYLSGKITNFAGYHQEIKQTYTQTWNFSEQMGLSKYLKYSDQSIDKGVYYLKDLSSEDMMAILFDYDFKRLYKAGFKYFRYKISKIWTRLKLKLNLT